MELTIYTHEKSGRLLALCPDVKGFAAQAKDMAELKVRVPRLMKALLEAKGQAIDSVEFIEGVRPQAAINHTDENGVEDGFVMASMIAQAQICVSA